MFESCILRRTNQRGGLGDPVWDHLGSLVNRELDDSEKVGSEGWKVTVVMIRSESKECGHDGAQWPVYRFLDPQGLLCFQVLTLGPERGPNQTHRDYLGFPRSLPRNSASATVASHWALWHTTLISHAIREQVRFSGQD